MSDIDRVILFHENFEEFPIGAFPYDTKHSALGEYHFRMPEGERGRWYDPIMHYDYRGPSWIITELSGQKGIEQMRVRTPETRRACPTLVTGDKRWRDYTARVTMRPFYTGEPCGFLVRYQTSLAHYAFMLCGDRVRFYRQAKAERELLAEAPLPGTPEPMREYVLEAACEGNHFTLSVDGVPVIAAVDNTYTEGCVALAAEMPARYTDVWVTATAAENEALLERIQLEEKSLMALRALYPQPKLWKTIDLHDFGAGRQIRFGCLSGECFFVIAQHQERVLSDCYADISCLTAVSVTTGQVLWQLGTPTTRPEYAILTADLPFQLYDIDGDGDDEVILARDFTLSILDGRTGATRLSVPTPLDTEPVERLNHIPFGRAAFDRVNVDAIRIVNVSGGDRPSDILIKDRYSRLWIYDRSLSLLWYFCDGNTGHFPYSHDFDGDGREEIFACYNMIDSNGKLKWRLPIDHDHTDEIVYGPIDPDREPILALVSGWAGFLLVSREGEIIARDINGHSQRVSVGNYCPDKPGLEICTTTYWDNQGIVYLYDCKGRQIWHMESSANGNIITPVNWRGDGAELILLNGNTRLGGMIDGAGRTVVTFPDDGHPDLCAEVIDLTGDARDEIVLWDEKRMFIYTQDRDAPESDKEYRPLKYPHYNASNYRGEYSFPRWIKTKDERRNDE